MLETHMSHMFFLYFQNVEKIGGRGFQCFSNVVNSIRDIYICIILKMLKIFNGISQTFQCHSQIYINSSYPFPS